MKSKHNYKRIISAFLLVAIGSVFFANFAIAQNPAPPTPTTPTVAPLDAEVFWRGQTNRAECETFKTNLEAFTKNATQKLTAQYKETTTGSGPGGASTVTKCVIFEIVGNKTPPTLSETEPSRAATKLFTWMAAHDEAPKDYIAFQNGIKGYQDKQEATNAFSAAVGWTVSFVIKAITFAVLNIASVAGDILSYIVDYDIVKTPPAAINTGWTVVRDFMNLFFIMGLIIISIATILRIESYDYKHLLMKLILMALLINFSKVIAIELVNIASIVTSILSANLKIGNYWQTLSAVLNPTGELSDFMKSGGAQADIVSAIGGLVLAWIMAVSYIVLAGMFILRTVGIWVLIVLSPVAFGLNILPSTKSMASKWWHKFIQYLIFGPVALFFLAIGQGMINNLTTNAQLEVGGQFTYLLAAAFMFGSVLVAKQSGIAGASAATGVVDYAKKGTKWVAGATGAYVARGGLLSGTVGAKGIANTFGLKGVAKKMEKAGDKMGEMTAWPQSKFNHVKEILALGNRKRQKQIDDKTMMMFAKSDRKLDKDIRSKMKKKHIMARMEHLSKKGKGMDVEEVKDFIEDKGRDAVDVFMVGLHDGMLESLGEGTKNMAEKQAVRKEVLKSFATQSGVREYQFEADYKAGRYGGIDPQTGQQYLVDKDNNVRFDKPELYQVGSVKSDEDFFEAKNGNPAVKDQKWRIDNRRARVEIWREDKKKNNRDTDDNPPTIIPPTNPPTAPTSPAAAPTTPQRRIELTDEHMPVRDQSSAERMASYRTAANPPRRVTLTDEDMPTRNSSGTDRLNDRRRAAGLPPVGGGTPGGTPTP